jgi:hemerythrin-like domain-containing protein
MNPIEKLMAEHRNILRGLDLLEGGALELENGIEVSPKFFIAAIDFIRNYADRYHHAKEEDILFIRMGEAGFSPEAGPVAVMLYEHNQGRAFVSNLERANNRYATGEKEAVGEIIKNAIAYVNLLRAHIQKEDMILYPMAENALGERGINSMKPDFEKVEREETGIEQKYLDLLKAMESRNPVAGS